MFCAKFCSPLVSPVTLKLLSIFGFCGVLELDRSMPRPIVFVPLVGVVFLIGDTLEPFIDFLPTIEVYFVIGVALLAA